MHSEDMTPDMEKALKDARNEGQLEGMIFILDILDRMLDGKDDTTTLVASIP